MAFKGWDILLDGTSVVTENLVTVATYEPKQLEVSFVDYDGKVISTQIVEYGKTAVLPDALDDLTDRAFMCWSISQNTPITEDIVVEPVVNYFETAETPNVSLESDAYDTEQAVEITTSDKSKIYYTLDGSDPSENGLEYIRNVTNG
ncbi:MAG: chitobiase/beta-hexosaminidase C-terminal domain-containing protein [Oscillospiraceae bacterium]|nr:chitobiase/beta-hexosaminidase C-terminal domain-containing protein [Oscillospiraceae bacterium]